MTGSKKERNVINGLDDSISEMTKMGLHEISIKGIDPFPKHPYKVIDDGEMFNLMESIKEYGVITPAIVRPKENGRYEMISGHRRLRACSLLGIQTIKCEVKELDRNEAIIAMVDSNLQRETILPSEKAFAYKMRLEALKRQGKRTDIVVAPMLNIDEITCAPVGHKFTGAKARDIIAKQVGESKSQIQRYIRLTHLIPKLLRLVDEGKIAMRPAVEISYLPKQLQEELQDAIEQEACSPTHSQTIRMRKMLNENLLNKEAIIAIMREEKPNQREKIAIDDIKLKRYLPRNLPISKREEYIIRALKYYRKHIDNSEENI